MHANDRGTLIATGVTLFSPLCPPLVRALDDTAVVTGPAKVFDGDTLDIGTTGVRLYRVGPPEGVQRCTGPEGT